MNHWWRGLTVNFRKNWKRVNYDLHSAVGFWTLLVLSLWAFSGVYFMWSEPIESFVNHFSSIAAANPPKFTVPKHEQSNWADLGMMIEQAERASPRAQFGGAFFPGQRNDALTLLMARGPQRRFTQMDYIYFDPVTGKQLAIWHRGVTNTWGSTFIFWLSPLHFGYDFGLAIKILWGLPWLRAASALDHRRPDVLGTAPSAGSGKPYRIIHVLGAWQRHDPLRVQIAYGWKPLRRWRCHR